MSAPPDVAHIMSHLADIRGELGLSQETVARAADVSTWSLRRWERGRDAPTFTHLLRYMHALGLRFAYIREGDRRGRGS